MGGSGEVLGRLTMPSPDIPHIDQDLRRALDLRGTIRNDIADRARRLVSLRQQVLALIDDADRLDETIDALLDLRTLART
jgi:hypothetical protein